jgi:hypothetical protein
MNESTGQSDIGSPISWSGGYVGGPGDTFFINLSNGAYSYPAWPMHLVQFGFIYERWNSWKRILGHYRDHPPKPTRYWASDSGIFYFLYVPNWKDWLQLSSITPTGEGRVAAWEFFYLSWYQEPVFYKDCRIESEYLKCSFSDGENERIECLCSSMVACF